MTVKLELVIQKVEPVLGKLIAGKGMACIASQLPDLCKSFSSLREIATDFSHLLPLS